MSDLPESLRAAREAALAQAFLHEPFKIDESASVESETLRAQQYLAAQAYEIRKALEDIAFALRAKG